MDKKIPEEILNSLSEKLPDGFVYTNVGQEAVGITPQSSEMQLQGLSVELPDDLPGNFKPSTINELTEFMYRTQSKIKLKPDQDNCITINGTRFKMDEFIDFPLQDIKLGEFEISMVPQPFQPPFEIILEDNGIAKKFSIQRQPYADMSKSLFKTIDNNALEISYIIDEIEYNLQLNFKLNVERARSIKEVIEVFKLYLSCIKGDVKLKSTENKLKIKVINIVWSKPLHWVCSFFNALYNVAAETPVAS